jgi:signal transduction histidine kinase
VIDPEAVPFNPLAPPVVVESAKIDNRPTEIHGSAIEIRPSENNLEIHYTGLSFIKPEQVQFKYKLEGLDENWIEAGTRREAFYPYLPPGEYTFRGIAANSDNLWNETGASLKITVNPPFYRNWIFIGSCLAAALLIIYAAYRRRISRLEKARLVQEDFSRRLINAHETERRRIAAELHDSLGQSLAMIKNRAVFGSSAATDLTAAKEQFEQISTQSAQAISEVREIAYNLRPYLIDRLGLTRAIKSMLNKLAEVGAVQVSSEIDDIDGLYPSESEMSIFRILQESLNNILKHSEASDVTISIKRSAQNVIIKIADNGQGFDASSVNSGETRGFGLLGMSERIKRLGGTQTIDSQPGKGTTVKINLNLPKPPKENSAGDEHE